MSLPYNHTQYMYVIQQVHFWSHNQMQDRYPCETIMGSFPHSLTFKYLIKAPQFEDVEVIWLLFSEAGWQQSRKQSQMESNSSLAASLVWEPHSLYRYHTTWPDHMKRDLSLSLWIFLTFAFAASGPGEDENASGKVKRSRKAKHTKCDHWGYQEWGHHHLV